MGTTVKVDHFPKRRMCPVCSKIAHQVSVTTIKHHVEAPWNRVFAEQGYYFCANATCDVVYFAQDSMCITKNEVRTPVGVKESSPSALICYCFGVRREEASDDVKAFVLRETKQQTCACSVRNPSGKCCLSAFTNMTSPSNKIGVVKEEKIHML